MHLFVFYDAATFKNKAIIKYNELYLPILTNTGRLGKHYLFFSIIFDGTKKLDDEEKMSMEDLNASQASIEELVGPEFEEENLCSKLDISDAATVSHFVKTKMYNLNLRLRT
eukprot:GHVP01021382.1.p1 GENE.GHVP01021382.1~~GHVP01021382.1.p1  ORF type:complete len:112 (+),score=18.61 GHVP01021382.1:468-803(+)